MKKQFFFWILIFFIVNNYRASAFIVYSFSLEKDTLIDLGTHKLHFVIIRAGEPTILLEAGGGSGASQWEEVQKKLANETNATIISYDRAGYGESELPRYPYKIEREVEDMHKCLEIIGVKKIILVGHSYGAFLSQVYQFMYPGNVIGIILADPNTTTFVDSIGAKILMQLPFDTTKPMTIAQKADVRQAIAFPNTIEAVKAMPYSNNIPMILLSAGKPWWPFPKWNRWWKDSHQLIVGKAENRTLKEAEGSAHNIPKERPDLIVDAITALLKKLP
ncbi:MAG: alpha/beta fold hydrolase [Chitinophagaceae bacterium]